MSMIRHYQERLTQKIAEAQRLSDETSALLKDGATLDDPRIQRLTQQRAEAHDDLTEYQKAIDQYTDSQEEMNQMRSQSQRTATGDPGHAQTWVAPGAPTIHDKRDGPMPFDSFGQQLTAVRDNAMSPHQIDPRLKEIQTYALGLGEAVPSEGGFLVQADYENDILRRIHETGKLISKPRNIPLGGRSNSLKINAVDEDSRVNGSRLGGGTSAWTAEGAPIAKSKPTFRQIELKLHKLASLYYATDEELQDTEALEETVASFIAEELGFKLDDALIRGLGAGEPVGILGHAGTVSVAKEDSQAANTIITENVEKMFTRLWARSVENAVWLINQNCWRQIFALERAIGTGGVPVFLPSGSISGKPFNTMLGLPIQHIEHCESLGTVGDIILADFASGYIMISKGGIKAASSIHVEFLTDQMVFRFTLRTDGQPVANAPLTPYKGTETQSSFITLATRA